MRIFSYASLGFEGELISVEVDIRRGIPGIDIVGMPDVAVRESRERVRIAIRRGGFAFPCERLLVNLAPAGVRKEGATHDLPIAVAILSQSGQITSDFIDEIMILGELQLSGEVRPVSGVLSSVAAGIEAGIRFFVVPKANVKEAAVLREGRVVGIGRIAEIHALLETLPHERHDTFLSAYSPEERDAQGDFSDVKGQRILKRGLEIATTGMHNALLFGPPGSGKTMSVKRLLSILPPLDIQSALSVTRIWSQAGKLPKKDPLIRFPPLRMPHHSASLEGLVGGGNPLFPGEVSLAHGGILFLDETPEFGNRILQGLREPMENQRISVARAGHSYWYPADFQLILAANPCPCGNLGRKESVCICSRGEIHRYWKKLGGALLDRIDIRIPVEPLLPEELMEGQEEESAAIRRRVAEAIDRQAKRYNNLPFQRNARVPPGRLASYCALSEANTAIFTHAAHHLGLSSRASHSVLKIARTIADLAQSDEIEKEHLLEAVQYRRYGDKDIFWSAV